MVFVGKTDHLPTGACKGWWLDEHGGMVLRKRDLVKYSGICRDRGAALQEKRPHAEQHKMAELIFVNGCGSAAVPDFWKEDPEGDREGDEISYPELFLAAGARFVVGTASEIDLRPEFTSAFLSDFFDRYARDPLMAVEHLYQTKHSRPVSDFQASLYQIYADREMDYRPRPDSRLRSRSVRPMPQVRSP